MYTQKYIVRLYYFHLTIIIIINTLSLNYLSLKNWARLKHTITSVWNFYNKSMHAVYIGFGTVFIARHTVRVFALIRGFVVLNSCRNVSPPNT